MASPLDFSLADLSPEQLKAQQDFQQKINSARGAAAPSAVPSAATGETAAEATARRAAGRPGPRPSYTSGAPRGAAPAAAPAGPSTMGQKAVGVLKGGKNLVGKLGVYGAAASAGANQFDDDAVSRYATRFAMDEPANDGSIGSVAKDAALRFLGFGSDLANVATLGGAGRFYRDKPTGLPFSEAAPEQLERPQTRAEYDAAQKVGGQGAADVQPAVGQQVVNVDRQKNGVMSFSGTGPGAPTTGVQYTGGAAAALKGGSFNTMPAANFVQPSSAATAELSAARQAAADRGDFEAVAASYGGDFGGAGKQSTADKLRSQLDNLPPVRTQGDLARYNSISGALAAIGGQEATAARNASTDATARAQSAFDQAMKLSDLGIRQQTADAATATAAVKGRDQIVQSTDAAGNPVLINKATSRLTRPTEVPDFATFDAKMREDKRNSSLTAEQMQAIYTQQFGQ